jgi:hypothetical protein
MTRKAKIKYQCNVYSVKLCDIQILRQFVGSTSFFTALNINDIFSIITSIHINHL